MASDIPRKHAHSLQRLYSLAFNFGTFASAKDQSSSFLDGLLRNTRHAALTIYVEYNLLAVIASPIRKGRGIPPFIAISFPWPLR
jgi:hypothetical protein